jgi:ABC-2 type transport system permease protein
MPILETSRLSRSFGELLALILGVHLNWNPLALIGVVIIVMLGAACFSISSVLIACTLRSRERVMGTEQILTMPLFFL